MFVRRAARGGRRRSWCSAGGQRAGGVSAARARRRRLGWTAPARTPFWLDRPGAPAAGPAARRCGRRRPGGGRRRATPACGRPCWRWRSSPAATSWCSRATGSAGRRPGATAASARRSLTHGLCNGLERWPDEMPTLLRLGRENLDGIEAHRRPVRHRRAASSAPASWTSPSQPWQVDGLRRGRTSWRDRRGVELQLLDAARHARARRLADLPRRAVRRPTAWPWSTRRGWSGGWRTPCERLGGRVRESHAGAGLQRPGRRRAGPHAGRVSVRARQVVLARTSSRRWCGGTGRTSCRSGTTCWSPSRSTPTSVGRVGWAGRQGVSATPATSSTTTG